MSVVQNDFRISQQVGVVGQPARPGQSFGEILLEIGATTPQPGQAFEIINGKANLPINQTQAALAVGIVSFSQGDINSPITRTVNHNTAVVYVNGDEAPCGIDGHFFVLLGGAVTIGDNLIYDTAADDWIVGVTTLAAFIAMSSGVDGDIIAVQINRKA